MVADRASASAPHVSYLLSDLGGGTGQHLFALLESRSVPSWSADIVSEVKNTARGEAPVPLTVLPQPPFLRYPFVQAIRWHALRHLFRDRCPDILHTYFFWSIIYGRLLKAEGVIHRLVENREDMGFNWGRHEYTLLRLSRRVPDRVICVSSAIRDVVLEREGLAPNKVEIIRNGVARVAPRPPSSSDSLKSELGIPLDAPIVGMVANFNRAVKGAVHYVDALALVARQVPNVRFLLIGLGDNRAELQARADSAGVGSQLVFTGFRDDIDRFYDLMDVAALTSLSEGLSLTILESMQQSVPVVATDVGGNREIVQDGRTGYLVPPEDPATFAARTIELLRSSVLRDEFGSNARVSVARSFDLSDVADRYGAVYRELLSSPS